MWSHIYGLDIETDTTPETAEELAAGYKPGNRGLDPRIGAVINAAIAHERGVEVFRGEEKAVLAGLKRWLHFATPGLLATWNGAPFDLPFLQDRLRAHALHGGLRTIPDERIQPKYEPLPGHRGGYTATWETRHGVPHAHLDVAYALKGKAADLGVSWSLKPVAKALGIAMVEVDRENIHLLSAAEQDAYVASDAIGTRDLAVRVLSGAI